jgi:hypothetical protein
MKTPKCTGRLLFAFLFSVVLSGCFQNYFIKRTITPTDVYPTTIERAKQENRFFILHSGERAYAITSLQVDQPQKQLDVKLGLLERDHRLYVDNPENRRYRISKGEAPVLTEIHLYTKDTISFALNEAITIPVDRLTRIELLEKNIASSTTNHILSAVGVTLGLLTVIMVIAIALKSSCPFVSGYDGTEFKLQGEIFGGSIYPSLQRNDYLPLQLKPLNGKLQVKISNELHERQYTDVAELWSIEHDRAVRIVPDEQGNIYALSKGVSPIEASVTGKNVLAQVLNKDESYFPFNSEDENNKSHLQVVFAKAADTKNSKLVLQLKNSYWLDYLYGEMISHMGSYFEKWSNVQKQKSAEELVKWKNEQAMPLTIEMKTSTGWEVVKTLTTVGPVAYREVVVPLDVSKAVGEHVTLRLSSGFMFWEIDRIAMDYTPSTAYTIHKRPPISATDELGKDVKNELSSIDKNFLSQPAIGNVATISYEALPENEEKTTTYILHTSGYYEHVRDFKGMPDVKFLTAFKEPGALSKFSVQRYRELNKSLAKAK